MIDNYKGYRRKKVLETIYEKLFINRVLSRWIILLIDVSLVLVSFFLAFVLTDKLYSLVDGPNFGPKFLIFITTIGFSILYFLLNRTYVGIIRYSTLSELRRVFNAVILTAISSFILFYIFEKSNFIWFGHGMPTPMSIMLYCVSWLTFAITLLFFFRASVVSTFTILRKRYEIDITRVYLWGLTEKSLSNAQSFKNIHSEYEIRGFIELNKKNSLKRNTHLPVRDMEFLRQVRHSRNILFLSEKEFNTNKANIEEILKLGHKVYIMKDVNVDNSTSSDEVNSGIRRIQIEDLLGRDEIVISEQKISDNINGKTILVSGAAGSIGSEIVRQIAKYKPKMILCLDQAETPLHDLWLELNSYEEIQYQTFICDIRRKNRVEEIFKEYKPDIIYHAAAYKHVPMMEREPNEAIITNVEGSKHMSDLALQYDAEMFVMVSTDKAVNPTNIMGTSKRIAEIYIQTLALQNQDKKTKFVTTRFGNVLGSNGSVIPLFRKQIEEGGPITLTHKDITRYFMTIPEACRLVLEASLIGNSGYIYVFDMGKPVKIYDLAKRMIELSGLKLGKDIDIEITGLRPGEKLYEELLNDSEVTEKTSHEKIKIARVRSYDAKMIYNEIDNLIKLAEERNIEEMVIKMKQIVPEFISKNSQFEVLDKK